MFRTGLQAVTIFAHHFPFCTRNDKQRMDLEPAAAVRGLNQVQPHTGDVSPGLPVAQQRSHRPFTIPCQHVLCPPPRTPWWGTARHGKAGTARGAHMYVIVMKVVPPGVRAPTLQDGTIPGRSTWICQTQTPRQTPRSNEHQEKLFFCTVTARCGAWPAVSALSAGHRRLFSASPRQAAGLRLDNSAEVTMSPQEFPLWHCTLLMPAIRHTVHFVSGVV